MTDVKLSALTELTAPAEDDLLAIDDVSDTSMAASGTTKKIQRKNILPAGLMGSVFDWPVVTQASTAATANSLLVCEFFLPYPATLTGVRYVVGGTSSGSPGVRAGLYSLDGNTRLATRAASLTQSAAFSTQNVAFDASYAALPGRYLAALIFSATTATYYGGSGLGNWKSIANGSMNLPTTVSPPTAPQGGFLTPVACVY